MNKYLKLILVMMFSLLLVAAGKSTLYVQSSKAKVMESPSFKAKVVVTAKKGQKLDVVQKKGRWYEVKYNGKKGWVSRLLVSERPPIKRVSVLARAGQKKEISSKARRRASVMTTAAAARGLAEDDRRRLGDEQNIDYAALEQMEAVSVSEAEVDEFMEPVQ